MVVAVATFIEKCYVRRARARASITLSDTFCCGGSIIKYILQRGPTPCSGGNERQD